MLSKGEIPALTAMPAQDSTLECSGNKARSHEQICFQSQLEIRPRDGAWLLAASDGGAFSPLKAYHEAVASICPTL
jgi:hypothetical protein